MSKQREQWTGQFGDDYHARNQVDWFKRAEWWGDMLHTLNVNPRSVLEIGCGPGWNLSAIQYVMPGVQVYGTEVNDNAGAQAIDAGLDVCLPGQNHRRAELVFTCGVMIHIPPKELPGFIANMINRSYRYVMCIEYEDDVETEVEYRGMDGMLWKRPYTDILELRGLVPVHTHGMVGPREGFDHCVWSLFEKPHNG